MPILPLWCPRWVILAVKAIMVIVVSYAVIDLHFVLGIAARKAFEFIISCELQHVQHMSTCGRLRIMLMFVIFSMIVAPNPNIQEGVTDLPR